MASEHSSHDTPSLSPLQRFSNRVADYVRYRPGYPPEVVEIAARTFGLQPGARIADVGSGTGKLSIEFLEQGFEVFGIEPNEAMRQAATEVLGSWKTFHNLDGAAESLPLDDDSVDLVIAGQAFHWFDQSSTRREFQRVLRSGGGLMLVWNNRRTESTAFLQAYEDMLLEHCPDYANVGNKHYEEAGISAFFGGAYSREVLRYEQRFDLEALEGRLFSSSYTPATGEARERLTEINRNLFEEHAEDGVVVFDYDTEVFFGKLH